RASSSLTTVTSINEQERKTRIFSHYSHHRHGSSSVDKNINYNDNYRLLSHIIKAQRHSDPYSIKWITEGPHDVKDFDKSYRTTKIMNTTVSSSNMFSIVLSSSSSKLQISFIIIIIVLLLSLK
ncbi:unnamed protein product, partial [Rotaria sp. Silwood2]